MAARNTASMAPGGAASSRVCGIGGSPRNRPQPAAAPFFVAEKLFDEFSLGRINALSSSSSSSADASTSPAVDASDKASIGSDTAAGKIGLNDAGFQPSAPPFECIGRSNAELYGFNDIFGGLPGIKPSTGVDDVFAMGGAGSKNPPPQNTPVSRNDSSYPRGSYSPSSSRLQATSAGSARAPKEGDRSDANGSQSQQRLPTTGQASGSPLFGDTVSSAASSSAPLPTSYSTRSGRGSLGPIGSSRFKNAGAEVRDGQSLENHQRHQSSVPPYTVKTSTHEKSGDASNSASSPNTALLTDLKDPVTSSGKVATPPASNMPSWFAGVTSCSPKVSSVQKLHMEDKEAGPVMNARQSKSSDRHSSKASERPLQDDHKVDPRAVQDKPLAVEEVLLSKENVTWENKAQSDAATADSPPRKAKRPSATERLKAVLFPDFGKKEDKDKSKAKSWFTVGDLKLVTQPTDVPPPNRAPPEMEHSQKFTGSRSVYKRDERWRRNSCEFPVRKDASALKEANLQGKSQPLPRANGEDFVGLSSSVTAMKEAVERAEAKIKQKQRGGDSLPNTAEADTRKAENGKNSEMKEAFNSHHIEKEGDLDREAVERAAHELREKALRKAAERAAVDTQRKRAENLENARSTSAPKQRISDEAERDAKKVFFSGEQCRPTSNLSRQPEPARNLKAEDERKHKILEERAAKVLADKNQRDLTAQQEQAERQRVSATVDAQIKAWAAGREGNLRALLLSLQDVLWPGSGWQAVSSSELNNEASIKKAYRKATLCVHPDKIQQRGATIQEKLIAEKVFDVLKGAWTKFNSQEAFFWQTSV